MKTAKPIAQLLATTSIPAGPNTIRCVVLDGDRAVCHTEATLDVWWANLTPEQKAAIYERDLEGVEFTSGVCRYCGCTDARACNPPCCWIDRESTVCSADACIERYESEREGELRDQAPAAFPQLPAPSLQLVPKAEELARSFSDLLHAPLTPHLGKEATA